MKYPTGIRQHPFHLIASMLALAGIICGTVSTASAQDRLFALLPFQSGGFDGREQLIEVDTRPESFGQIRRTFPIPMHDVYESPVSIGGGRYLVWLSGTLAVVLHIFDTQSERYAAIPGLMPSFSRIMAVDPERLRVFVQSAASGILILDGVNGTVREIPAPTPFRWSNSVKGAYAASANRLFASIQSLVASQPSVVDVIDVDAGVVEKTLTLPAIGIADLAVNRESTRLFVAASDVPALYVYDPRSGTQLAHHAVQAATYRTEGILRLDEGRRRVLLRATDDFSIRVAAFDLDTLAFLGVVGGNSPRWTDSGLTPFHALTGPRSPLYVFNSSLRTRDDCSSARLERLDPNSGALQQRVEVSGTWGALVSKPACRAYLTLLTSPPTPTLQSPSVNGRQVTLTWTPSTDALHYDLEIGSAAGLGNLGVSAGHTGTAFTIDGAPSGTYYVRIRAINTIGRSLPSNEVEIIVP